MHKYIVVLFVVFSLFTSFTLAELDPVKLQLIDEVVENYFIPSNHITGLGLSIVENNETVLAKGYGYQDIEDGRNATNRTLFSIGSISKSFGATIIIKVLHEKFGNLGEGALDTPIVQLAPGFNFTLSDRYRTEYTTFRDLLSHRNCLQSPDLDLLFSSVSRTEYKFRTRYQTEACTFRNGFQYNNAMYSLVGEIIANIANSTIEQMVMEFMQSIGMSEATYFDSEESYLDLPTMSSSYYRKDNQTFKFNNALLRRVHIGLTAGGILASSTDMAQYINFHLNKGRVGNTQLIPADVMAWLYKISNPQDRLPGKELENDDVIGTFGYGLGFDLQLYKGYKVLNHGGYWPPFHSGLTFIPARNTGIFSSTNGPGAILYGLTHDGLHAAIYDILQGSLTNLDDLTLQKYYTINKVGSTEAELQSERPLKKMTFEDEQNIKKLRQVNGERTSVQAPEDLIGLYGNANSGDMNITIVGDNLQMNFGEWGIGKLIPSNNSETNFIIEWLTDIDQHHYTYGELIPVPISQLDFSITNVVLFIADSETTFTFEKNKTLDSQPIIPWPAESCGPIDLLRFE